MTVGKRYRPIVTILKVKKGRPTVIKVSGEAYRLILDDHVPTDTQSQPKGTPTKRHVPKSNTGIWRKPKDGRMARPTKHERNNKEMKRYDQ